MRRGHAAALAGGTTMHIDFALPVAHDLLAGWEEWQRKARDAVGGGPGGGGGLEGAALSWGASSAGGMGAGTHKAGGRAGGAVSAPLALCTHGLPPGRPGARGHRVPAVAVASCPTHPASSATLAPTPGGGRSWIMASTWR